MITYNPKDWFSLIFRFQKSDTFRILMPTMLSLGLLTGIMVYVEDRYVGTKMPQLTIFHQISGFVISLVLVFRINTAYDRWWEGRKLWGSLINNSRNLALKLNGFVPAADMSDRHAFYALISSFAFSLKEHLRNQYNKSEIIFCEQLEEKALEGAQHKPAYIAGRLTHLALRTTRKNNLSPVDYQLMSKNIDELIDICGACERIKNTPIPYSYSLFIKKVIFLYIITMPVTFGFTISYWSVPVVMIIFFTFASLELLSEEIEDPFGHDPNDLPTDELSEKIRKNVQEILLPDGRVHL